jgi:hypothetical protein
LRNKGEKVDGGFSCQFKRLKAEFDSLRQHLTKLLGGFTLRSLSEFALHRRTYRKNHEKV